MFFPVKHTQTFLDHFTLLVLVFFWLYLNCLIHGFLFSCPLNTSNPQGFVLSLLLFSFLVSPRWSHLDSHGFNDLMSPKYVSLYQTLLRLLFGFPHLMAHHYLKFNIFNTEVIPPTHLLTPVSTPQKKSHLLLYSPSQLNVPLLILLFFLGSSFPLTIFTAKQSASINNIWPKLLLFSLPPLP